MGFKAFLKSVKRVKKNSFLKAFIIVFFGGQFLASQILSGFAPAKEVYPIFHWSLFSHLAETEVVYTIIIKNREKGPSVCEWRNCSFVPDSAKNNRTFWLIQDMGKALNQNPTRFKTLKSHLERMVNFNENLHSYSLEKRTVRPKDYALRKEILYSETLETY